MKTFPNKFRVYFKMLTSYLHQRQSKCSENETDFKVRLMFSSFWTPSPYFTLLHISVSSTYLTSFRCPKVGSAKGKNTHTAERGGAERPAACDLIRANKSTALFPRIKSQAAGRCMCVFTLMLLPTRKFTRLSHCYY